jgi:hypothetical protein
MYSRYFCQVDLPDEDEAYRYAPEIREEKLNTHTIRCIKGILTKSRFQISLIKLTKYVSDGLEEHLVNTLLFLSLLNKEKQNEKNLHNTIYGVDTVVCIFLCYCNHN